jgi:hypothetical protein
MMASKARQCAGRTAGRPELAALEGQDLAIPYGEKRAMSIHPEEAPSPELAGLLQSMAAEGSLSSSGVFTIDVRAALPKLEKFQLPRPHFGLLKVIQSAVGSGASYVDTSFGSSGISIEHDGDPPRSEELRDLLSYLLSTDASSGDRALRDLAIGVNTSLARGASWVEVSARTELGWVQQRWVSREETDHKEQLSREEGKATVRFEVRRTLGQAASEVLGWANKDLGGLLHGSREVLDEDARGVFDRCRHAPVDVRINGRPVPASSSGHRVVRRWSPFREVEHRKPHLVEIYLQARQESRHLMSAPERSQARYRFAMEGDFNGLTFHTVGALHTLPAQPLPPRRCFAVIGIRGRAQVPGEMVVVKDGVDLARLTPGGIPKGVSVILSAEGLRLDLSQFVLSKSQETEERLAWLSSTVSHCCRGVLQQVDDSAWSQEERRHLVQLARQGASKEV